MWRLRVQQCPINLNAVTQISNESLTQSSNPTPPTFSLARHEAAGVSAVDNAMVEAQGEVLHGSNRDRIVALWVG